MGRFRYQIRRNWRKGISKVIKYFCDRCRREITRAAGRIAVSFLDDYRDNIFSECHFCSCCMDEVKEFIKTPPIHNGEQEEVVAEALSDIKIPQIWAKPGRGKP